jgi:hypothetical protein
MKNIIHYATDQACFLNKKIKISWPIKASNTRHQSTTWLQKKNSPLKHRNNWFSFLINTFLSDEHVKNSRKTYSEFKIMSARKTTTGCLLVSPTSLLLQHIPFSVFIVGRIFNWTRCLFLHDRNYQILLLLGCALFGIVCKWCDGIAELLMNRLDWSEFETSKKLL